MPTNLSLPVFYATIPGILTILSAATALIQFLSGVIVIVLLLRYMGSKQNEIGAQSYRTTRIDGDQRTKRSPQNKSSLTSYLVLWNEWEA